MKSTRYLLAIIVMLFAIGSSASEVPSVVLKNTDGKNVDTGKLTNDGRPIVLSFFATWCKPCLRELAAIDDVYEQWREDTGVRYILVSTDDAQNVQKVKPLVDGQGWEFEVLLDITGELKRLMQVQLLPHVFVIDGNGKIVYNHSGYTDGSENELYKQIVAADNKH